MTATAQLTATMRQLMTAVERNTAAAKAQLRQWWTVEQLMDRWGMSDSAVRTIVAQHAKSLKVMRRPLRVHLDSVLQLDRALEKAAHTTTKG